MTPTARALAECRRRGWIAQVVEQTIPHSFIKRDFLGCIDIIALVPGQEWPGGFCCMYKRPYVTKPGDGTYTCTECGNTNSWKTPPHVLGIQVTSGTNHAARIAKIAAEPRMRKWCESGGKVEVWSYSKRGGKGKRKLWTLRTEAWWPMDDEQAVAA